MTFTPLDIATETTQADVLLAQQNIQTAVQALLSLWNVSADTLASAVGQDTGNATLIALLTELGQKLEPGDLTGLATSAKQDTMKDTLAAILAAVDGLEGFTDGIEALLTTIGTYVDGLEANTAGLAKTDVATTLTDGRKTGITPATAVAIRSTLACKWVTVTALLTNTQQVNVGGSAVSAVAGSSNGVPLLAGQSVTIPVADAATVFVDARVSSATEGVSFMVGS